MSISMYSSSVPVFVRLLGNLGQWLDKAEARFDSPKSHKDNEFIIFFLSIIVLVLLF